MFSRAQVILSPFKKEDSKIEEIIPMEIETEHQESPVFHTLGDLDKYQDVLLVDVEEN